MNTAAFGLSVDKIHVWRGDRHVLRGTSLEVQAGEILHVSGPNGSGKTTLMRVICGLLRPEQGRIAWEGRPIADVRAAYQAAMTYASHEPALKGDLTALENLRFSVGLKRRVGEAELRAALDRTAVGACADLPARVLSAGQRRRVAMARVLAVHAKLWLLDEPYTNLDAAGSELLSGLVAEHAEQGGIGVIVAHHLLQLDRLEQAGGLKRLELAG